MIGKSAILGVAVSVLASGASAGSFAPPPGCTAYLTLQQRGCVVEHYWTCVADAPGVQWSGEIDRRGLVYIGKIDAEAQWVHSFFLEHGTQETLISPATDPASFSNLVETGLDTYEFKLDTANGHKRVVGFDRLSERDVMIDGVTLHRTEYSIRETDETGQVTYESQGSEYVSEMHGRFFSGTGTVTLPDTTFSFDNSPVDFIYPDEPGFLTDTPLYGCDALAARHATE